MKKIRKSPGYDKVIPNMIKNLPKVEIIVLLRIFNTILNLDVYQKIWKTSQILMIPKPGKDLILSSSYRPIRKERRKL